MFDEFQRRNAFHDPCLCISSTFDNTVEPLLEDRHIGHDKVVLFEDFKMTNLVDTEVADTIINIYIIYSGPCNLRPTIQPAKYGLKLKVFLK